MFLITLGHGLGNRMIQERFQHLGETVSRHFIRVLDAIYRMSTNIIEPIDREFKEVPHKIRSDNRYYPSLRIVLVILMEPICQWLFPNMNSHGIVAERVFPPKLFQLFVILRCVLHSSLLDRKARPMIHVFFQRLQRGHTCDFHIHLQVYFYQHLCMPYLHCSYSRI